MKSILFHDRMLSAINRKLTLQFAHTHQKCTTADLKNPAWLDDFWYLFCNFLMVVFWWLHPAGAPCTQMTSTTTRC